MTYFIHETSIVDNGVSIGDGTKVWHFSHISENVIIGANCTLGQNTFIGSDVEIGNRVKIQNNVSVYNGISIADDVFIGPSVVFTNVINPRAAIDRKTEYSCTLVREGVTLGANCTIVCGCTLGAYSFIGAGSVVTKNTKEFGLYVGNPARLIGWYSKFGKAIPLPLIGSGRYHDPSDGSIYELLDSDLKCKT